MQPAPRDGSRRFGQGKDKQVATGGRAILGSALVTVAMVAVRHDPTLAAVHQRLVAAGMPKTIAPIAVAGKLRTIPHTIAGQK